MFSEIKHAHNFPWITVEALITSTVVDVYTVDEIKLFFYKKRKSVFSDQPHPYLI